jgi:Replication initiation factor
MAEPFADFVGFTVPAVEWAGLHDELALELEGVGMSLERDDERVKLWRSGGDGWGTVREELRGQVWAVGISGTVCAGLRAARRFLSVLAVVGARPHRVTRLDAALDLPEDAAPVVARIAAAGRRGELALTRKGIKPTTVETHLGLRVDGVESGTVYCGSRAAEARMVVYDKRHERMSRKLPDNGNLTRYELRLKGGLGISLRDCAEPAPVFWHHVAPDFLPAPEGAVAWSPAAEGFELERLEPPTPFARMLALLDQSPDVGRLLKLADQAGPYGFRSLVARLELMAEKIAQRSGGGD